MDITRFDPQTATDEDYEALTALRERARVLDAPDRPPRDRATTEAVLRTADQGSWPAAVWLARDPGARITAVGHFVRFAEENEHLAILNVTVDPPLRGRGIGTEMYRLLLGEARRAGKTRVSAANIPAGGPGEKWALARGFAQADGHLIQRLRIDDGPRDRWDALGVAAGYRVQEWTGSAPEALLESLAAARNGMQDMPRGDLSFLSPAWTPERIRKEEDDLRRRGAEQRMAVAVHEESGEVAGITELIIRGTLEDHAEQHDTTVLAAHRGRGLGTAIKAANLRRLVRERPEIEAVYTQTSVSNVFMQRVNHGLGFADVRTELDFEAGIEELAARLA